MPLSMPLSTMPSRASTVRPMLRPSQPAAAVAEVVEPHELDGDHVGGALELEGLDGEVVVADRVEHAVEAELAAVGLRWM